MPSVAVPLLAMLSGSTRASEPPAAGWLSSEMRPVTVTIWPAAASARLAACASPGGSSARPIANSAKAMAMAITAGLTSKASPRQGTASPIATTPSIGAEGASTTAAASAADQAIAMTSAGYWARLQIPPGRTSGSIKGLDSGARSQSRLRSCRGRRPARSWPGILRSWCGSRRLLRRTLR